MDKGPELVSIQSLVNRLRKRCIASGADCVCGAYEYTAICGHVSRVINFTCPDKASTSNNPRSVGKKACKPSSKLPYIKVTDARVSSRCHDCIQANTRWAPKDDEGNPTPGVRTKRSMTNEELQNEQFQLLSPRTPKHYREKLEKGNTIGIVPIKERTETVRQKPKEKETSDKPKEHGKMSINFILDG
ncbi:hypothetical protein F5Y11DRAFT_366555 [Daldinia sp. FL1419]|nr:hypothetical protein F5Y11DRAFT_366555 [Daldinia sp. FL1419]